MKAGRKNVLITGAYGRIGSAVMQRLTGRFEHSDPHDGENGSAATLEQVAEYTCPMHSDIMRREPGHCPRCGTPLVPRGGCHRMEASMLAMTST